MQSCSVPSRYRQPMSQIPLFPLHLLLFLFTKQEWILARLCSRAGYDTHLCTFCLLLQLRSPRARTMLCPRNIDSPVVKSASASAAFAKNSSRSRSCVTDARGLLSSKVYYISIRDISLEIRVWKQHRVSKEERSTHQSALLGGIVLLDSTIDQGLAETSGGMLCPIWRLNIHQLTLRLSMLLPPPLLVPPLCFQQSDHLPCFVYYLIANDDE